MNLLDSIVNETGTSTQVAVPNNSISTETALRQFGRGLPFRGLLRNVQGVPADQIQARSGLEWRTAKRPIEIVGLHSNKPAEGYQALVRSDNGEVLDITSAQFKPHQNTEILADMLQAAAFGEAEIVYAGPMDGGRRVVAIAKMQGEFTLPGKQTWNNHAGPAINGADKTALFTVISGGHQVGTPFKIRGMAFRLWCANGAFFTQGATATFTVTHRLNLETRRAQIQEVYNRIRSEFQTYGESAARLQNTEMERNQSRLYVAELLKPGIAQTLSDRLGQSTDVWMSVAHELRGARALDAILKENESEQGFARSGKNLLDAIVNQEGRNGDNLWSGFNGITWYVDHQRGRNAETGLNAAMFGAGADLKERALTTALQFAR